MLGLRKNIKIILQNPGAKNQKHSQKSQHDSKDPKNLENISGKF